MDHVCDSQPFWLVQKDLWHGRFDLVSLRQRTRLRPEVITVGGRPVPPEGFGRRVAAFPTRDSEPAAGLSTQVMNDKGRYRQSCKKWGGDCVLQAVSLATEISKRCDALRGHTCACFAEICSVSPFTAPSFLSCKYCILPALLYV